MKRRYKGISIATAMLIVSPLISGTAFAEPVNGDTPQIDSVLNQYAEQIQSSYSGVGSRSLVNSKQEELAHKNGGDLYDPARDGLNLSKTDVSTEIVSATQFGTEYKAKVLITTKLHMTPKPGTTITIAGEKRNSLDSSGTYEHAVTLAPDIASGTHGYSVIDDQVQLPHDEINRNHKPVFTTSSAAQAKADANFSSQSAVATRDVFTNGVGLNYLTEMRYAELWTDDAHTDHQNSQHDIMNIQFPVFSDNCTNFVSQALYAGGLKMKKTNFIDRGHDDVWAYMGIGELTPTYTWGGADNNHRYMQNYSQAFTVDNNPHHLGGGAVLYADWEGDGTLDHAAIVTGNIQTATNATPVICQKTHNHHDEPMTFLENYAKSVNPRGTTQWRGLQWKP